MGCTGGGETEKSGLLTGLGEGGGWGWGERQLGRRSMRGCTHVRGSGGEGKLRGVANLGLAEKKRVGGGVFGERSEKGVNTS